VIDYETLKQRRDAILEVARRHGAHDIRIIGSVARGEATGSSDVDLIVRFEPGRTLFDQGELVMDLQDLLGVNVDVISEGGIRPRWRNYLKQESVPL
jgi:uncharacterized protein